MIRKALLLPSIQSIPQLFDKPVIPVLGKLPDDPSLLALASSVIIQGVSITDLPIISEQFAVPALAHIGLLVHIDLVSGLENNESGIAYLATLGRFDGVVTIHHYLAQAARQWGLKSVVRIFLSDSRALDRGLKVVNKSKPDAFEVLPAAVSINVADVLNACPIPHIAGGLCRTEQEICDTIAAGSLSITSTSPKLWQLNR